MDKQKVDFTGVQWTMLVTLYCRAVESRSKDSILADHVAADALYRIDYDFDTMKMRATAGDRYLVVLRVKQLDLWTTDFLSRHPDATVLQLGCGLDSRAFRLDLPVGVRWFDVDYLDVGELRRELYPERDGYRTRDGREIERWNPRLKYVTNVAVISQFAKIPVRAYRVLYRLMSRIPVIRDTMRVFHFEF